MNSLLLSLKRLLVNRAVRWLALPVLGLGAFTIVVSQTATPTPPPLVSLASEPLYARGVRAKPTLTLALSVEFPTVGQAYLSTDAYVEATEYVGYFDPQGCYSYIDANKRFERASTAAAHVCGGAAGFSGNFMNWASTSAIDVLRYGLTGGDRITDTATETVLQRAVLPNSFYNSSNFGSKSITAALAARAIPAATLGTHTGTVFIANCSNRIFFGTAATGSCDAPGANGSLGTNVGTTAAPTSNAGFTFCVNENNTCTAFTGTKQVIYGASTSYVVRTITNTAAGFQCSNGVFGDPIPGSGKACYFRDVPTGTAAPTNKTVDPYFTTRVAVCGSSSGTLSDSRADLCLRYPNGNFKPVGNLQKYSDRMRVSAFGYLRDDSTSRYGGVLRAPMKYVGPKSYNADFNLVSGTNAEREWDESTGVFVENPTPLTGYSVSGVTNYLNRFGRTSATPGAYKTYDPVNELYYESLRYIQGLPPTDAAVTGVTGANTSANALTDGYPVYTSWTDPHPAITGLGSTGDYSCVKNNILTIGDVNVHYDRSMPGSTVNDGTSDFARAAGASANEPDFRYWTSVVGGFESANSVAYTDGSGVARTTSNPNVGNAARNGMEGQTIQDHSNYFMSGMAYWANTHDIRGTGWSDTAKRRPGMRARTYIIDVNEYGAQSDANTRRNNQFFLAAKYGGFKDESGYGNPFLRVSGTTDNSIWQQSNGDAKTYFLAGQPALLLTALDNIFEQIASEANSIAGGAITTQTVTSTGGNIFQASFDPNSWSGDIISYTLGLNGDGTLSLGSTANAAWRAAPLLNARTTARNILVGRTTPTTTSAATNFVWADLPTDHQLALTRTDAGAEAAAATASSPSGEGRVLYLRGSRAKEIPAGPYRTRTNLLGDIVNSGVTYKGAPSTSLSGSGYATFYSNNRTRTTAVYAGANDGMLHAFDATNGSELFAYIPSFLVSDLYQLTGSSYVHRSYVDATPTVAEADIGSTSSPNWKTVLVSGVGAGGQGVFAIDVTNPSGVTASSVMWEFTHRDDADLGNVIGKPKILKIRTSSATATTPTYKWFAVFGSGVNNYASDGYVSATNKPALFFLDLSKPVGTSWARGTNYFKVSLPQSSTTMATGVVGFSAIVGDANELKTIYAGDLQGNMWKLNFSLATLANATNVAVSTMLGGTATNLDAASPLYVAQSSTPALQAITMEPTLIYGPNGGIVVVFGTGKFIESTDNAGPHSTQSTYAVLDNNVARIPGRARLAAVTQNATTGVLSGSSFTWGVPASDTDAVRAGWYFDFSGSATSGERQISNMTVVGTNVVFGSLIPAQNGCDQGSGRLYVISQAGGVGTSTLSTVGIMGQPFVVQLGSSSIATSDSTGRRTVSTTRQTILQGSGGVATTTSTTDAGTPLGRQSWRQLNNFQEIKNATP